MDAKGTKKRIRINYDSLFGRLAELMHVGVLILDEERTIEFANPRICRLIGCSEHETLEACWAPVQCAIEEALAEDPTETGLEREVTFDRTGRRHHLLLEIHALDEEACTGHLILVKDYAELNRTEDDLHLAARFRNAAGLYRALAHNLRHPVTAILIRIDLLKNMLDDHGTDVPPDLWERSLETVRQEVQELNQTLDMLLDEMSPALIEQQSFSLPKLVADLGHLIEPQARQQGVTLQVHVPEDDVALTGRRDRIKQAILNLAVNALEALPTGGTLRLALRMDGVEACIDVIDDGPGIPDDVRIHIFEKHFTTKKDGTGIGLHLVREAVQLHDGMVEMETSPTDGTTFRIRLPAVREEKPAPA